MEVWLFISGYLIHFWASAMMLWKITQYRSIYGLSIDTQICFLVSTISRCIWSFDTRLVETWVAYLELCCSAILGVALVYHMILYRHTSVKSVSWYLSSMTLIPGGLILAVLFHPGRAWVTIQILVAFTIYLEAIALVPQLYLMRRMIEIETLTSVYVGLLILSRIVRLLFWLTLYFQGEHFVGLFLADAVHCLLSADYFLQWCRRLRHGGQLILKN